MEVFSPERVGWVCKEFGLIPGPALDLQTGYYFSRHADRDRPHQLRKARACDVESSLY